MAVVGTSGSGKSTLLHMMGGLDTPTSGSVVVRDKELAKMNDEQLTIFRRRNIGFVFQNYNLVPILNVYENIVLPVELDGDTVDKKFMDEVWPAAARGDCPRPGVKTGYRLGRRTYRQPGQQDQRRCPGPAPAHQPGV